MLRNLIFAVCALALTLASCGRQVTPNRNNTGGGQYGLQPGYMQIKFNTVGQLDFVNNWYVLAFNTSGTGGEPYALFGTPQQNWKDWSFEIVVYQPPGGQVQAQAYQFITQQGTGTQKSPYQIRPTEQQLQVTANCNNQATQFCITVDRHIFSGAFSPAPSSSPSASPSGSPSAAPSGSPSPSPTPVPTPPAGTANVWYVNWFVASPQGTPQGQVVDAPGQTGINDTTFQYTIDTTQTVDVPWTYQAGWTQGPSQSATIAGGEILNNP